MIRSELTEQVQDHVIKEAIHFASTTNVEASSVFERACISGNLNRLAL